MAKLWDEMVPSLERDRRLETERYIRAKLPMTGPWSIDELKAELMAGNVEAQREQRTRKAKPRYDASLRVIAEVLAQLHADGWVRLHSRRVRGQVRVYGVYPPRDSLPDTDPMDMG